MIATASKSHDRFENAPKILILIATNSTLQSTIARRLQSRMTMLGLPYCRTVSLSEMAAIDLTGITCIFLPELEQPFLHGITKANYACLQRIVSSVRGLLWITGNDITSDSPTTGMVTGFARCIRGEYSTMKFITLALQEVQETSVAVENIMKTFQNTLLVSSDECETDYVESNGLLCIGRVVEADCINQHIARKTILQAAKPQKFRQDCSRRLKLSIGSPGLLDTLHFIDDENTQPISSDEIEILVKASGLNFRDVLIALGQDVSDYLGMECAGVVSQAGQSSGFQIGDRVCALSEGSLCSYARCKASTAIKMPDDMTFQSAAAIPVIYSTALYALTHWARMKTGESILIHSGAGGLGQACIQLAKLSNANIYVTVSSEEKKKLMKDLYNIPDSHIFSSRTSSFVQGIKNMTQGRGVDVIVNSLAGEALKDSWECIAPFGSGDGEEGYPVLRHTPDVSFFKECYVR